MHQSYAAPSITELGSLHGVTLAPVPVKVANPPVIDGVYMGTKIGPDPGGQTASI